MNASTEPTFIALRHGMECLMHNTHEPIMYSRKKIFKLNDILPQCFFKSGSEDIKKTKKYSNFLQTYCDVDHAIYLYGRLSVTSEAHLLNGTVIYCRTNRKSETPRIITN